MEYYDKYNNIYLSALNASKIVYCTKVLVLNWQEEVIGDITNNVDLKSSSFTVSQKAGVKRTATLSLINNDGSLDVNENKLLWALRKFQIFKGVKVGEDIYWFSLGIFVIKGVNGTSKRPVVTTGDKWSLLNGDIKLIQTEAELQIPDSESLELLSEGSLKFINVIRYLLQQAIGNGYILDDKELVADPEFDDLRLQKQIVISSGFYPAAVIEEMAETYMYNAYYDTYGRLRIVRNLSDDYYYLAPIFRFSESNSSGTESNYSFQDVYNAQTVEGSNVDSEVFRYTARNDNPRSPIRISLIGERKDKKVNIQNGDSVRKCEMYANYLLKRKTAAKMSINFNASVIPHIDSDKPILKDGRKLIVQSASFPLSGGSMKVSACPIEYIPFENQ